MQRSVRRASRLVGGVDPWLVLAFLGLSATGMLMVYSSSIPDSFALYRSSLFIFQREVIWVVFGFTALVVASRIHYKRLERLALPIFVITVLMLTAVLVPHLGHASNGARRWFSLGAGVTIEPSELIKLAVILYLASWLTSKGDRVRDLKYCFFPFCLVLGLIAVLIVRQPDLGTTIVVAVTMLSVFFVAGGDMKHLVAVATGAVGVAYILAHSSQYRFDRLMAFQNPWKDPTGAGYHTVQVLLALGSGGIIGRGLGNSIQKSPGVLPAPYTDSILAVIGEEWGLIGTVAILVLFLVIAYRGIRIAMNAPDSFGRLLAAGITSWITFQALMNFAVITSSVPFTGVPLPFISYGGTSTIITMAAMGILLNISRHASGEVLARQSSGNGRGYGRPRVPRVIDHPAALEGTATLPVAVAQVSHASPTGAPRRSDKRATLRP